MSTKTCKNCGWVYPITQPGRKCIICGEPFEFVLCSTCGVLTPLDKMESGTGICKTCAAAYERTMKAQRRQLQADAFDDWIARVKSVPKSYPALSEKQWLDACTFFDGCARCRSKDIDARGFFVGPELGGRYCDWNVIPLCERCASRWNLSKNVFIHAEFADHIGRKTEYRECLTKIIKYLGGKLDAATKVAEVPTEPTDGIK